MMTMCASTYLEKGCGKLTLRQEQVTEVVDTKLMVWVPDLMSEVKSFFC